MRWIGEVLKTRPSDYHFFHDDQLKKGGGGGCLGYLRLKEGRRRSSCTVKYSLKKSPEKHDFPLYKC